MNLVMFRDNIYDCCVLLMFLVLCILSETELPSDKGFGSSRCARDVHRQDGGWHIQLSRLVLVWL